MKVFLPFLLTFPLCLRGDESNLRIMYLGGAQAPLQQSSFNIWNYDRGTQMIAQIRGSYADLGTGYGQVAVRTMDYKMMVGTTSQNIESWNAEPVPGSGQYGSLYCEGFYLYANNGETFIPSETSVNIASMVYYFDTGYQKAGNIDYTWALNFPATSRFRMDPGPDNLAGTADDIVSEDQDMSVPTVGLVFLSPGAAFQPYGSGDDAQRMRNSVDFMKLCRMAFRMTVTGTGSVSGPFSFVRTTYPGDMLPENVSIQKEDEDMVLRWTQRGITPLEVQTSADLIEWDDATVWVPEGTAAEYAVPRGLGPQGFLRLKTR